MDRELQAKIDTMADNYERLKSAFKWEYNVVNHFGALVTMTGDVPLDVEQLKRIRDHIHSTQGFLSNFRGHNELVLAYLLLGQSDYQTVYERIVQVHSALKDHKFKDGMYLPLTAYIIATRVAPEAYSQTLERMRAFYDEMTRNHFWTTSQDDYVLAAVLATTHYEVEATSQEIERCYKQLSEQWRFAGGNNLQALAHVLALGEASADVKCRRAIEIQEQLALKDCKLKQHGLSSLGVLTLLGLSAEVLAREVAEVNDYLYHRSGYGFWHIDATLRVILAASIVSDYHADQLTTENLTVDQLINSVNSVTQAIIVAEQLAVMSVILVSASTSAAAGASS